MAKRAAYKRRKSNKGTFFLCVLVIALLGAVVGYNYINSSNRLKGIEAEGQKYTQLLEEEQIRKQKLEDYEEYTMSKAFVEDVAPEKFGVVKDNQILLKPAD